MTEAQARAAGLTEEQIAKLKLSDGKHQNPSGGHCLLEVVSIFAGESFTDHPACVDPVLAAFGRSWNDSLPDDKRQELKRYIVLLPGTAQGKVLSQRRAWLAVDWAIRVNTAAWLDLCPATAEHAAKLRALAPITSEQQLAAAQVALDQARSAAAAAMAAAMAAARAAAMAAARAAAMAAAMAAARAAAMAAARAAAMDAAMAAAWDAAWAAAMDAAWAAARAAWAAARAARAAAMDAAMDAAQKAEPNYEARYEAAYAVVREFLNPTEERLHTEAHALYLRMINERLTETAEHDRADVEAA